MFCTNGYAYMRAQTAPASLSSSTDTTSESSRSHSPDLLSPKALELIYPDQVTKIHARMLNEERPGAPNLTMEQIEDIALKSLFQL